ncbi:MAG: membrane protein insertase YidC [Flavobacteriales bacterium]|nr:membrane protein insertase YidC [Flavobacteriales bacterium]
MFDRNTVIGLVLMLLFVIGYTTFTAPSAEEVARQRVVADSLATLQKQVPPANDSVNIAVAPSIANNILQIPADSSQNDSARTEKVIAAEKQFGPFANLTLGAEEEIIIRNNKLEAVVTTRGAMFKRVTLKDGYHTYWDSTEVQLWDEKVSEMFLGFEASGSQQFTTKDFYFTPSAKTIDARKSAQQLVMRLASPDGEKFIELIYDVQPDSYVIGCKVNASNLGSEFNLDAKPITLNWNATGLQNEKGLSNERSHSSIYFREFEEKRDYLSEGGEDETTVETKMNWAAYKQNYFSAAVISKEGFNAGAKLAVVVSTDSVHTKQFRSQMALPMKSTTSSTDLTFFFGPNEFKTLKSLEVAEFDRIIDYGWSIIGWVNKHCIRPMFVFFDGFNLNYGIIILIITLIIKLILFPVTWKNFLSSAKMRVLKPDMEAINLKYKDDAMGKQQATMSLYRQTGVNPFAGCIPVLLQMPILYAMFRFFPASIEFRGKGFLWADDLGAYDSILNLGFNIPLYGSHVSGFTVLMCISTFFYTRMTMANTPAPTTPGMPNMKIMMHIFTVMMLFFFNGFASGLSLYYLSANLISIGQMWVIKTYIIDEEKIHAKIQGNKLKPKKKSSFAERVEDMQKKQKDKLALQKAKLKR